MSSTLEASIFMGKNYLENLHSIKNTEKRSIWDRRQNDENYRESQIARVWIGCLGAILGPYCTITKWSEDTLERTKFDRDTLNQQKHDNVTDPTSTGAPVCGHESTERCVLTLKHVEYDQTSTV